MRKLRLSVLALLLAVVAVGCDSTDNDESDAELFVGTWALTSISDATGNQTAGFANLANSLTVDLNADNSFSLLVDYKEDSGRPDLPLAGTYTVDEGGRTLTLTIPATQQSLPFGYDFRTEDEVVLEAGAALINPLFNPTTPYEGTVEVVIEKQ